MKQFSLLALVAFVLTGCLTTPVSDTGGFDGVTVLNSNPANIVASAQSVFAESGYSSGPSSFPDSVSFDKPGGAFGQVMWGSYGEPTTVRARVNIIPIPGTNNYRLTAKAFAVTDAGEAGFEEGRPLLIGSGQFTPLLRKVAAQAGNTGAM